jgi:hypothetical protein
MPVLTRSPEPREGGRSPWGKIDHVQKLAEGIWFCGTPGHGGIKLSRERQHQMPKALRCEKGWYEEDLECVRVFLGFPELFLDKYAEAENTLIHWHPHVWSAWKGQPAPEWSRELRKERFLEAHKNDYLGLAAWGDWKEGIPKGMVGVFAGRGGRLPNGMYPDDCKYFLVPSEEYAKREESFVIDLARHQEVPPIK